MDSSGLGKSPNSSLSFRYNANNEELEELINVIENPSGPLLNDISQSSLQNENTSPKKVDKTSSLLDKYFKSMRADKPSEKPDDMKSTESKNIEEIKNPVIKDVTLSPMKEYLNRLGKKSNTSDVTTESKEGSNETWKIFHDFKFKIAQAVEDMKTRSVDDTREKCMPRENSTSDSEENSVIKDSDQQSVCDTDNQVSSLHSSIQNLSELTQPLTAKVKEKENATDLVSHSESSDDTHKNLVRSASAEVVGDLTEDNNLLEVESGVEALEDSNIGELDDVSNIDAIDTSINKYNEEAFIPPPPTPTRLGISKKNSLTTPVHDVKTNRHFFFNSQMYFFTFLLFVNYAIFPESYTINGFLIGIWFFSFVSNLKRWLLENYFSEGDNDKNSSVIAKNSCSNVTTYTIPSVKEHRPLKKFEGWINHYRFPDYDPYTYHINKTTTAFIKLQGCNLRISYTRTKIPKRALWDEKIENTVFYQHRLYNLTGARVIFLPKGLVRKRQWSKKYPICIILNDKEKVQVLEKEVTSEKKTVDEKKNKESQVQQEVENVDISTSPEKKRKFIWRRRERSNSHNEGEPVKEGLRHRFSKKNTKEKKNESVSAFTETDDIEELTCDKDLQVEEPFFEANSEFTNSDCNNVKQDLAEEDMDETELARLKEFLEDAELESSADGTAEGEWSVHTKHSKDNLHLYLFTRTGRDKHEWFRRLNNAIAEANTSTDSSVVEDKTGSDSVQEQKEGIEMAVYRVTDKETVAFKPSSKTDALSGVTVTSLYTNPMDLDSYEKTFWPYLFKIIQAKNPSPTCQCRMLPAEVSWVNTVIARVIYDVMRDPKLIKRVQNRIQKKLNTLKLPVFMSPLVVTELSLAGACPLVSGVSPPTWDERGVWLDAELQYDGGAYITILTQINLMKFKEKSSEDQIFDADNVIEQDADDTSLEDFTEKQLRRRKPAIFDSEVEDSAESSSDDESPPVQPIDSNENVPVTEPTTPNTSEGGSSKKKFLRMVDKITTNKYFQQVTDYKYVKRAMEGLSNTDIKLQVEIQGLEGRLAVNLPPPPHDRLWLGFRTNPQLVLKARPAVGARTVRITQITSWIEQKLSKEFEKVLVLPNMEDIAIDVMTPTPIDFE